MGGTEGTADQKFRAEIDFSINNMVSCHIPMEILRQTWKNLRAVKKLRAVCFKKWANITQNQFV